MLKSCFPIIHSMIATIINALAIVLGSAVGLLFGKKISSSLQAVIMYGAGTITLILGIQMAMEMPSAIVSLFALVIGGVIGTVMRIEERIFNLGEMIGKRNEKHRSAEGIDHRNQRRKGVDECTEKR